MELANDMRMRNLRRFSEVKQYRKTYYGGTRVRNLAIGAEQRIVLGLATGWTAVDRSGFLLSRT